MRLINLFRGVYVLNILFLQVNFRIKHEFIYTVDFMIYSVFVYHQQKSISFFLGSYRLFNNKRVQYSSLVIYLLESAIRRNEIEKKIARHSKKKIVHKAPTRKSYYYLVYEAKNTNIKIIKYVNL